MIIITLCAYMIAEHRFDRNKIKLAKNLNWICYDFGPDEESFRKITFAAYEIPFGEPIHDTYRLLPPEFDPSVNLRADPLNARRKTLEYTGYKPQHWERCEPCSFNDRSNFCFESEEWYVLDKGDYTDLFVFMELAMIWVILEVWDACLKDGCLFKSRQESSPVRESPLSKSLLYTKVNPEYLDTENGFT